MVDILVRNIDDATAAQLKKKAKAAGKSVNDFAREALRAAAKPSKQEVWPRSIASANELGRYPATPPPTFANGATMTSLIVDASVAVKWFFEEPGGKRCSRVARR